MDNFSLKIEGFDSNSSLSLSKVVFDSFIESDFIKKLDTEIILKSVFFSEEYKVPNVCRYQFIKSVNGEYNLLPNESKNVNKSAFSDVKIDDIKANEYPTIILILESPHKDEYDYFPKFTPKAPAQGVTGTQICEKFEKIINNHLDELELKDTEYRILIINPIPYQTSLYYCHQKGLIKNIRDFVWETLWKNGGYKSDFINILTNIEPDVVINACTKDFKNNIDEIIVGIQIGKKCQVNHPSSWGYPKGNYKLTIK